MKVYGKDIAQNILEDLKQRAAALKKKGIIPHLTIVLIGDDPASQAYVKQKVQKGEAIGAKVTVKRFPPTVSQKEILNALNDLNHVSSVHGIIVQRPLPHHIDEKAIDSAVFPDKDVDGFNSNTMFHMPLAAAVLKILETISSGQGQALSTWLMDKTVVVMGKGKTGGGPVLSALTKLGVEPLIIDSKTGHPKSFTKTADVIICAVGKPHTLTNDMLKKNAILIAVGMHKGADGRLHGDYDEKDIKDIAGFYTAVPGGVGPVNVAMLLENLVRAAEHA